MSISLIRENLRVERKFKSQNPSPSGQLEMKTINGTQVYLTNTLNNLTLAVNENGTLIQEDLQLEDGVLAEHQGRFFSIKWL